MDRLRAMRVFVKVVELGSFAAAARALDLAPAVVTRLVADLEDQLGARLMNRSTRRLSLTEVGSDYLQRLQQILHDIDEADALASDASREARGTVRLLLPPAVSVHQLAKHLPRFFERHPQVTIDLSAQGPIETPDDAFDISILWTRRPPDGEFIARRLARTETIVCASPAYLDRRGRPQQPPDLATHDAILPPIADLQQGLRFRRGAWRDDGSATDLQTVQPARAHLYLPDAFGQTCVGGQALRRRARVRHAERLQEALLDEVEARHDLVALRAGQRREDERERDRDAEDQQKREDADPAAAE